MNLHARTMLLAALLGTLSSVNANAAPWEAKGQAVSRTLKAMKEKRLAARAQADAQDDELDDDDELESTDVILDRDGREHVRFDRRYKGLRVVGGDMVVHGDGAGRVKAISRSWKRRGKLDVRPTLTEVQAANLAVGAFPHRAVTITKRELIVWAVDGKDTPAWDVVVEGLQADGTPSSMHQVVHARTGEVLAQWDDVHTSATTGTGRSQYSGSVSLNMDLVNGVYNLRDTTRGNHYVADTDNRTDLNLVFFKLPAKQTLVTTRTGFLGNGLSSGDRTAAADAAYGFQTTWDYFLKTHGRNGIDGQGRQVYSRVHYGSSYNNAFWQDSCFCMTYGDGDGQLLKPLISLDVVGHEMAHGVTGSSAKLIYSGESGGLNESTSDIFGSMVEHHVSDSANYLIGEKIAGPALTRGYLRTMVNPSADGKSADCWYPDVGKLDVHNSSGVANHLFYLLAEGTTQGQPSRTCRSGDTRVATGQETLLGIGRHKAERIWYRALTVYMTSNTNFAGARQATINAANDLFGANSEEVNAVMTAWSAVNVN